MIKIKEIAIFTASFFLGGFIFAQQPSDNPPAAEPEPEEEVIKASTIDEHLDEKAYNEGVNLLSANNFKEAIIKFDEAIKLNPDYEKAYINRASAKKELKNLNGAIEDFSKAIEINPNSSNAFFGRAQVYYLQNKKDGPLPHEYSSYSFLLETESTPGP